VHELSIAQALVEAAEAAARAAGGTRVTCVRVTIGALSGVAPDALRFAYDVATDGTLLAGSTLDITEQPLVVACPTCARDVELPGVQELQCPACGTPTGVIRKGREMDLMSLDVESDEEAGPQP
jgi:hydrogenase nickel incorporation protein HypA/HybF